VVFHELLFNSDLFFCREFHHGLLLLLPEVLDNLLTQGEYCLFVTDFILVNVHRRDTKFIVARGCDLSPPRFLGKFFHMNQKHMQVEQLFFLHVLTNPQKILHFPDTYNLLVIFILNFINVAGVIIGLAIGDAMGAPLEGLPAPRIPVRSFEGGGIHGVKPGHFTDDTLQAIAIAESLVFCGDFSPEDILRRLMQDYEYSPQYYGPTSSAVFNLLREGALPDDAARRVCEEAGGGRSNGSVMRGAPIGVYYPPPAVREVSIECARLTHRHPVAAECSAFINRMVSGLARGEGRARAHSSALSACMSEEVREVLVDPHAFSLSPSLDALEATHCAVAVYLGSSSFEDAVVGAINLGGDADTIGAICGALAGAEYGIGGIPPDWLADLHCAGELLDLSWRLFLGARR
jgi:ADP-ribosyl-[dinitrogen reductase] hydrolase